MISTSLRRSTSGLTFRGAAERIFAFRFGSLWIASAAAIALFLASVDDARAHAVVFPKKAAPKSYEKYVLRVPNERDVPTSRVEIRFPPALRIVSFGDVSGWQMEVQRDSAGGIVGAVWTGSLPPERFIEFPFVAVNPASGATVTWPTVQTYATGERVEWTGSAESRNPVSSTVIDADDGRMPGGYMVPWAALLVSLLSLGLVLRSRTPSDRPGT